MRYKILSHRFIVYGIGHPIPFCKVLMWDSHTNTQVLVDNPSPPNSPEKIIIIIKASYLKEFSTVWTVRE